MALLNKHLHRLAISNPEREDRIEGLVTGSSIVRALRDNLSVLGPLAARPLGSLFPTGGDVVIKAPAVASTARECFDSLLQRGITGMPLVDSSGAITANFSLADISLLAGKTAEAAETALSSHSGEFVSRDRGDGVKEARTPITVTLRDTLAFAIEVLASSQVRS